MGSNIKNPKHVQYPLATQHCQCWSLH